MRHRERIAEEEYDAALKDAQRIYEKAMANPRAKDVIDAEIDRAHKLFEGFSSSFDRPKEIASGILVLGNICDVLIRIVENQKLRIDKLEATVDDLMSGFNAVGDAEDERQCYDERKKR